MSIATLTGFSVYANSIGYEAADSITAVLSHNTKPQRATDNYLQTNTILSNYIFYMVIQFQTGLIK